MRRASAVGIEIRINAADALTLRDALTHGDFRDDVAVDVEPAIVFCVDVEGDPLAEAGRRTGAGDESVADGVDGLSTGTASEAEVCSPMVSAGTWAEAGRDHEPLGDWHCCHK